MNFLLIFSADQGLLDKDAIHRAFLETPGTKDVKEGDFIGSDLQCEFDFNGDSTIARLSRDRKRISIHGTGDASLQMALELQRRYPHPLRVTDMDYGFDLFLGEIGSVEEFDKRIRDAYAFPDAT